MCRLSRFIHLIPELDRPLKWCDYSYTYVCVCSYAKLRPNIFEMENFCLFYRVIITFNSITAHMWEVGFQGRMVRVTRRLSVCVHMSLQSFILL